ncbi:MAG TPA: hypothetical protein DCS93_12325 [Microscillaceae bacterium]|nr:hypothetical protein [Microscillaceae bacterium]
MVTAQGISSTPVKSTIGNKVDLKESFILSQLAFSPPGNTLAMLYFHDNIIRLFDFDTQTGKLTNARQLQLKERKYITKVTFSPSGQKLYALAADNPNKSTYEFLYQFDLLNKTKHLIISNQSNAKTPGLGIKGIQLAKDGKIYIAQGQYRYLGVINFLEGPKEACGYDPNGIDLGNKRARYGLPSFPAYYFRVTDKIGVGTPFRRNIEFTSGQAIIQPKYYKLISDIAAFLQKSSKVTIIITGHTDNTGTAKGNLPLSEKRAQAVAQYLTKQGIDPKRIIASGQGSKYPIANNKTAQGRQQNRRIEFFIQ